MKTRAFSWTTPYAAVARAADAREGSGAVEPRLSLVTLGVRDLRRAVAFYRDGLGWPKSEVGGDEVAFFKTGGAIIALFPRASFAADAGVDVDDVEHGGFPRLSLAHNVAEEGRVGSRRAQAAQARGT